MIEENEKFFSNVCDNLDKELAERVPHCTRYISTNETEKQWLKYVRINRIHRFAKSTYGLLLEHQSKDYLCLINTSPCIGKLPEILHEIDLNAGLATVLGAAGMLTPKPSKPLQLDIYDRVLYQTFDDYKGHDWEDIRQFFPNAYCYEITSTDERINIRNNINAFYWILSQVAIEFNMGNNPFGLTSKSAWEKIIYEGNPESVQYKNILLSYTALSWDISFLYLYQCLEDKFAYESVYNLHSRLKLESITPQDFSRMLYDELSWQPKDLDGIERIINKCPPESECIKILKSLSGEQSTAKYIYSMRNGIVHETRETIVPLTDDETWDKVIAGMLYLLKRI